MGGESVRGVGGEQTLGDEPGGHCFEFEFEGTVA